MRILILLQAYRPYDESVGAYICRNVEEVNESPQLPQHGQTNFKKGGNVT